MKIFLDSLDVNLIKQYADIGLLAGITTNPTFARRFEMADDIEMISKVRQALGEGEIHVEAFGENKDEILKNANNILGKTDDSNLVFKIPFSEHGIGACKELLANNIKTNLHLIFSINQAMLAASIKSTYICPLVGRLDDSGYDAMRNIKEMVSAFIANSESTMIMVSSVRHPQHVTKAYECGVDAITIPPSVLSQMFYHSLTDIGVRNFRYDIEAIKPISATAINRNLVVSKDDSLQHCLSLMVMHKGGAVAVCAADNCLAGIFTAGDLKRLIQKIAPFKLDDKVERFMVKNPISISINEPVSKAGEIMKQFNIDQLVVVDNESVAGILDAKEVSL
ncbi:transaldolase family protein [Chloroflexota bacterium]